MNSYDLTEDIALDSGLWNRTRVTIPVLLGKGFVELLN